MPSAASRLAPIIVFGLLTLWLPHRAAANAPDAEPPPATAPTIEEYRDLLSRIAALEAKLAAQQPARPPTPAPPPPPAPPAKPEPFAFGDFTWMNGSNRQPEALLSTKYFTGSLLLDINYTYSFNNPADHTIVGSTVTGRHNELDLLLATAGGDFHYQNVHATLTLQYGSRLNLVQGIDPTAARGQDSIAEVTKYIREASFGLHFDVLYGLNLDVGIFMSYIGGFSYLSFENWAYQPSYVADNTPWYFEGARLQLFPTERLKLEVWVVNGWQSFSKFNETPGFGFQINYRPREWLSLITNNYVGFDAPLEPDRMRFHTDDSLQLRYFEKKGARGLTRGAIAATFGGGLENGGTVTYDKQYFLAFMLYHRLWFFRDLLGWTVGGGLIDNPGRYLVSSPPGTDAMKAFPIAAEQPFFAWDISTTLDFMPNPYVTLRAEFVHRSADVPYFNGPRGLTSNSGYLNDMYDPAPSLSPFVPQLVNTEDRLILAFLLRL